MPGASVRPAPSRPSGIDAATHLDQVHTPRIKGLAQIGLSRRDATGIASAAISGRRGSMKLREADHQLAPLARQAVYPTTRTIVCRGRINAGRWQLAWRFESPLMH